MRATYGFDDIGKNASLIHLAEAVVRRVGAATIPGRYFVSAFPMLKYVPGWMPGAKFQQELKDVAQLNHKVVYTPFEDAKANVVSRYSQSRLLRTAHPDAPRQTVKKEGTRTWPRLSLKVSQMNPAQTAARRRRWRGTSVRSLTSVRQTLYLCFFKT